MAGGEHALQSDVDEAVVKATSRPFNFAGAWDAETAYDVNDVVTHAGKSWGARPDVTVGDEPGFAETWQDLALDAVDLTARDGLVDLDDAKQAKFLYDVRDYGAVGDGTTDDSAAIQAALDAATVTGGRVLIPAGRFAIASGLHLDLTSITADGDTARVSIVGAGSGTSALVWTAGTTGTMLTVTGTPPGSGGLHAHQVISGLGFWDTGLNAVGLRLDQRAFIKLDDLHFRGLADAITSVGLLSAQFVSIRVRSCVRGFTFEDGIGSPPNAITLIGCSVGTCSEYGLHVTNPTALTWIGGGIEGCGRDPGPGLDGFGAKIIEAGSGGANAVAFIGTYFEANHGVADAWLILGSNPATSWFSGCTFNRVGSTWKTDANIRIERDAGDADGDVTIAACGFRGFGSYTPSAARPYVASVGTAPARVETIGNVYGSALEAGTLARTAVTGYTPGVCARRTSAAGVPNGTGWTAAGLTAADLWDTHDIHASSSNELVIPASLPGRWRFEVQATWVANTTGDRRLRLLVNGTDATVLDNHPATAGHIVKGTVTLLLAASDVVQPQYGQDSGGSLNLESIRVVATYVGPVT